MRKLVKKGTGRNHKLNEIIIWMSKWEQNMINWGGMGWTGGKLVCMNSIDLKKIVGLRN